MRHTLRTSAVLAALLISGCGDGEADSAGRDPAVASDSNSQPVEATSDSTPSPDAEQESGPGAFRYTSEGGAVVTLTVPTPATDPRVKELESYRKKVGARALNYIYLKVDNSAGLEEVWTNTATVVTADNRQVEVPAFSEVNGGVEEADDWPEDTYTAERVEMANKYGGVVVQPGAIATTILATYEDISDPMGVHVPVEDYGESYPAERVDGDEPTASAPPPPATETPTPRGDALTVAEVASRMGCELKGEPEPDMEAEYKCGPFYIVDFTNGGATESQIVNEYAFNFLVPPYENFAYLGDKILLLGPFQAVEEAISVFPGAR